MTTIMGVKAKKGKKIRGIVFGSDLSATSTNWNAQGDIAYKEQTKYGYQKIRISDDKSFAVGIAGAYDDAYLNFFKDVLEGKFDIEKILSESFFPEFRDLNLSRWNGEFPNSQNANEFLIASRFNNQPNLHRCYPLGKVHEYDGTVIGSGAKYVMSYIEIKRPSIPNLTLNQAIDLVEGALSEAGKDIYTVGLDLVVVKPDKVHEFLRDIQKTYDTARKNIVKNVKRQLK